MSTKPLEVNYYKDKVSGETKIGKVILSQNLQIPDSISGVLATSKKFKEFFEDKETFEKLKALAENNSNEALKVLPIHLNNATQDVRCSGDTKRIEIKTITDVIQKASTVHEFKNEFSHLKLTLKFIGHSLYLFRASCGKEDLEVEGEDQQTLILNESDQSKFEFYDGIIKEYNEAQEIIQKEDPQNILDFMRSEIGKYDSLFSPQECIKFLFRILYNLNHEFEMNFNLALNLYFGIPIFNLKKNHRKNLIEWVNNRNWPDEEDYENEKDDLKKTGYNLGKWAQKMVDIINKLEEKDFDVKETEESIKFYSQITENNSTETKWTYVPLLKDTNTENGDMNCTLLELPQDIYLTLQQINCNFINENNLYIFEEIQVSSMQLQQGKGSYARIRRELCKTAEIQTGPESNFVIASRRNNKQASFDFDDDITDIQFIGDSLFFYKIDGAKEKIAAGTHNLLFIKLSDSFLMPLLIDSSEQLSNLIDVIIEKLKQHNIDFSKEEIEQNLRFGNEEINWEGNLESYYERIVPDGDGSNLDMREDMQNQGVKRDKSSSIGVMFSFNKEIVPSYKKKSVNETISFKVLVGELIENYYRNLSEEKIKDDPIELKYLKSDILGVEVSRYSKKMDYVSDFEIDSSTLGIENGEKLKYRSVAILTKLYNAYDLLLRKEGTNEFYSSNDPSKLHDEAEIREKKQASVVFYENYE